MHCLEQEPFVGKNHLIMQPNSCKLFSAGTKPRAAIYTSKNINFWAIVLK